MITRDLLQELDHPRHFLGPHSCQRLVEQQHLRRSREHHRNFQLTLLAVRQRRRDAVPARREPGRDERMLRRLAHRRKCGCVGYHMKRARNARLRGKAAVFECGESGKDVGLLKAAADPDARSPVGCEARDVLALVPDAPAGGRQLAGEKIDERRLAGTVGPQHRVKHAGVEPDCDIVDRHQPAEPPAKALRDENRLSHPISSRLKRPATLASPPGKKITSAMIVAPSRSCQCVVIDE